VVISNLWSKCNLPAELFCKSNSLRSRNHSSLTHPNVLIQSQWNNERQEWVTTFQCHFHVDLCYKKYGMGTLPSYQKQEYLFPVSVSGTKRGVVYVPTSWIRIFAHPSLTVLLLWRLRSRLLSRLQQCTYLQVAWVFHTYLHTLLLLLEIKLIYLCYAAFPLKTLRLSSWATHPSLFHLDHPRGGLHVNVTAAAHVSEY
jgi:hypothetical protein